MVAAGERRWVADNVWSDGQLPAAPGAGLRRELTPHRPVALGRYRNPAQLQDGASWWSREHSGARSPSSSPPGTGPGCGRDVGQVPFRIDGAAARLLLIRLVFRVVFYRVLTTSTPLGRKLRPKLTGRGLPLVRVRAGDLAAAGIQRAPKVVGTRDGMPLLEDGRVLEVANVIWCSGFHHGFSWIDLPVLGERDDPLQRRGIVGDQPGLYFSACTYCTRPLAMIHGGAGRRARRQPSGTAATVPSSGVGPADQVHHRPQHHTQRQHRSPAATNS